MHKLTTAQQRKLFKDYKEKAKDSLNVSLNLFAMHTFSYNKEDMIKNHEKDLVGFVNSYIEEGLQEELLKDIK